MSVELANATKWLHDLAQKAVLPSATAPLPPPTTMTPDTEPAAKCAKVDQSLLDLLDDDLQAEAEEVPAEVDEYMKPLGCYSVRHPISFCQTYGHATAPDLNPVDYMVYRVMEQPVLTN